MMQYVEHAETARRGRWLDRDELLSTSMALVCVGMLVFDLFGLRNQWPWFGTLFYLTCFTLVVLLPSNIALSVVTLKSNLESPETRRGLFLPVFNLALGAVQLWLLWEVVGLLFSALHRLGG